MLNKLVKTTIRPSKRLGRGLASGKGKTSGRGTKGQKSRSGYNIPARFEGGQTPLTQRLPKVRGFKSRQQKPVVFNIYRLEKYFKAGEIVSPKTLLEKGLIRKNDKLVKILGSKITTTFRYRGVKLNKLILESVKNSAKLKTTKTEIAKTPDPKKVLEKI